MAVHNESGHGFREKTYKNALCIEFKNNQINFIKQKEFPVKYKNEVADVFIPDLIVEDKIIIELKAVEKIIDEHIGQILNYLRVTGLQVGLIINFRHPELQWKPIVLEKKDY